MILPFRLRRVLSADRHYKRNYKTPKIEWTAEHRWAIYPPLAGVIASAIEAFKDQTLHGYPAGITEDDNRGGDIVNFVGEGHEPGVAAWNELLDRMAKGFREIELELDGNNAAEWLAQSERNQETLDLFGKWFFHLWD